MKVRHKSLHPLLLLWALVVPAFLPAQELSEEELERWFEGDEQAQPYPNYSGSEVLQFIAPLKERQIPFSQTRLLLSRHSKESGWVAIEQCHDGLDAVPNAEVVYRFEQMRGLRITEAEGIAVARVEGQSVQLRDVERGARLCVEMEAKILRAEEGGRYLLRYGPFMRKFLDSYFPMHVALAVSYPAEQLRVDSVMPAPGSNYLLSQQAGLLTLDAWFRGKLTIQLWFQSRD